MVNDAAPTFVTHVSIDTGVLAVDQRHPVVDLVLDHDDPLGELLPAGDRRVEPQHVDPRLLEVVDVGDVVDVSELVHVGPAQRAAVEVTSHTCMLADSSLGWPRQSRRTAIV